MSTTASAPAPGVGAAITTTGLDDDRMKNAVAFLQHPKVAAAPLQQKVAFLEKKGLSKDEICYAFRQIDPNSPDAVAIEKGTIEAFIPAANQAPMTPVAAQQIPSMATYPAQHHQHPVPMMCYPYAPMVGAPLQTSSSRLPLYSALVAALLAAGGGLAYFYRHVIAEKLMSNRAATAPAYNSDNLKELVLEATRTNQELLESLQRNSENTMELLTKLTSRIELLSASKSMKTSTSSKPASVSDRPDMLSPAMQALLEGTASSDAAPCPSFDFPAANEALNQALEELERSTEAFPAVSVLRIYIKNLIETGSESTRFHRISLASPTYEKNVAPYPVANELLQAVGFRQSDGFLVWNAPLGGPNSVDSTSRKKILATALDRLSDLLEKIESTREDDA